MSRGVPEAIDTTVSAYDLLSEEDRESLDWVRDHGGLDALRSEMPVISYRASLVGSVYDALDIDPDEPGAAMLLASEVKRLRDDHDALLWMDEHGGLGQVKMDYAMGEGFADLADRVAAKLGVNVEGLDAQDSEPVIMDAIDRRLMPEGVEWPRFEDGEPVRIGDEYSALDGCTDSLCQVFLGAYSFCLYGETHEDYMAYGKRVKRPETKVLDADGAPIRFGDEVWSVTGGLKGVVSQIVRAHDPDWRETACVRVVFGDADHGNFVLPDRLTHERPDSWERLEEDANKNYATYWECDRIPCYDCPAIVDGKKPDERYCALNCLEAMKSDLVRRARALAERGAR